MQALSDPLIMLRAVRDTNGTIADFTCIDANEAAARYIGTAQSALIGLSLLEQYPRAKSSGLFAKCALTVESNETLILNNFLTMSGNVHVERRLNIQVIALGDDLGFSWRDVTTRDDLLQQYQLLAENVAELVFRLSPDLIIEWISPVVESVLGFRPDQLVGQSINDLGHPDNATVLADVLGLVDDEVRGGIELQFRHANGHYRWISATGRRIVDTTGVTISIVGTGRVIDDEHASRVALEASEVRYRLLADYALDVVFQTDVKGVFTWVSPSAQTVMGWTAEELIGTEIAGLCVTDDLENLRAARRRAAHGEELDGFEFRMSTKSGDVRWLTAHVAPIRDDQERVVGFVSGLRDTTKEVATRQALAASEARFRLLAENASDLVMLVDAELLIQWVSPSVESILGWRADELLGTAAMMLIHEDDREKVSQSHLDTTNALSNVDQLRMRKLDGTYVWMAGRSQVTFDDAGRPSGRVISQRDVDHEVKARGELARSEATFRLLAENATDVVYEIDKHGTVIWASPSIEKVLGRAVADVVGRPSITMIHELDSATCIDHRCRAFAGEELESLEIRYVDGNGGAHWMAVTAKAIRDSAGLVLTEVVGLHNIDAEVTARDALADSKARYQLLAEHSSDVVIEIGDEANVTWVSPSVTGVLGWRVDEIIGAQLSDLFVVESRSAAITWIAPARRGERVEPGEFRLLRGQGDPLWMAVNALAMFDEAGRVLAVVVSLRTVQSEVISRRAVTTLSSGSRAMIRAADEIELLHRMCQVAVDDAGYRLAWYGKKVTDESYRVDVVAKSPQHSAYVDQLRVTWADEPLGRGPMGRAIRTGRSVIVNDLYSAASFTPWRASAFSSGLRSAVALPVSVDDEVDGALIVYAGELDAFDSFTLSVLEDLAGELGQGLRRLRDQERLIQSLRDHQLLSSAIDQAGEAIVVCDLDATIIYANPATVRSSGYEMDELLGANPRIFQSGLQSPLLYQEMWVRLTSGESWSGLLVNRRKNGEFFEEDTTISPIHDALGGLIAYVAVKHDLTSVRRLEAELSREQMDRDAIVEVMREVHPAATFEGTADAFCEAATRVAGIDAAALMLMSEQRVLLPVAFRGPLPINRALGDIAASGEIQRALESSAGPSLLRLEPDGRGTNDEFVQTVLHEGIRGIVVAPLHWEQQLVGVLLFATKDEVIADEFSIRLAYFEELGSYAASLVGDQALAKRRHCAVYDEVRDIIKHRRFTSVFQPMVNLTSGITVGYEALTRFDDARRPDLWFLDAHNVGLGTLLEAVCVEAALEAAQNLDTTTYLSVNFSPNTVLDGNAKRVVRGARQRIIIELTEHVPIEDYVAVRAALDEIDDVLVAVDDAGAGYTSLRHILELRPDFVKLDISIVRDIDSNRARQAMAAGICHFAQHDGTMIIAEGIETEAEAQTLRHLGVDFGSQGILGQGFYFAPPGSLD